jgi:hypothetical protein
VSTFGFKELYETVDTGAVAGIPDGVYNIKVSAVRVAPKIESRLLFLDLDVLDGPAAGKVGQVSLYLPDSSSTNYRNQSFHFRKKIAGFWAYDDVKRAFANADNAPSVEDAFNLIADALLGKVVKAELGLIDEGQYKGNNELQSTEPPMQESLPPQTATVAPQPNVTAAPPPNTTVATDAVVAPSTTTVPF